MPPWRGMRKEVMSQFLRVNSVARRYDTTPSTIWRWANEERFAHLNFPKPVPLGPNTRGWDVAELDSYDETRRALREDASVDASERMKAICAKRDTTA